MTLRHGLYGLLLLSILGAPGIAAELVITKSTVIGLEPGMVIDGGQELTLRKNHKLSLISPTGKVINLTGPYTGVPDSSQKSTGAGKLVTALSTLISGQRQGSSQLGAIRAGLSSRRVDPYPIDITDAGDQCVVAGKPVVLWAPGRAAPVDSVWIARSGSDEAAKVTWPKDAITAPWPKRVPVIDGAQYELLRRPAKEETVVKLHVVPAVAGNKAELAVVMQEKNCMSQAFTLIGAN
jgi:hypothetical protein